MKKMLNTRILEGWKEKNPSVKIKTFDCKNTFVSAYFGLYLARYTQMISNESHVFIAKSLINYFIFVLEAKTLNLIHEIEIEKSIEMTLAANKEFLVACVTHITPYRLTYVL